MEHEGFRHANIYWRDALWGKLLRLMWGYLAAKDGSKTQITAGQMAWVVR